MAKVKCGVCGDVLGSKAEWDKHMKEKHLTTDGGMIIIE